HCAMPIAGRQLIHNAIASAGQVLAVRPDAKSPAAAKQVEFVLASVQTAEQIAAKCKIPTIAEEVTVELILAATPVATRPSADAMAFQARVLNDLQRSVMKIRMVPVEQLFRRFPRMVRDVSRQCGREVELVLSGQETDLDKGILDSIAEPLTHMVRNAVSHGIEPVEERRRSGKPPHGTVRLRAHHQGNQVVVEVSDDGRGMDVQRIRSTAIQLGV